METELNPELVDKALGMAIGGFGDAVTAMVNAGKTEQAVGVLILMSQLTLLQEKVALGDW